MKNQSLILILLLLLLTSAQASAATVSWNELSGGPWSISANWNPAKVPDSGDDVFIINSGSSTIRVETVAAAKTLTVGGAKGISLSTGKLTIGTGDYTSANIGTLKYVPAGAFLRDGNNDNKNISTVTTAFRMSQYEITRSQFSARMGTDPSDTGYSTGMTDPVQYVNWYHAIAFCNKLSIAESLTPVYSVSVTGTGLVNWSTLLYSDIPTDPNADWDAAAANWYSNGYRLPTEMEWMWAAMGATMGFGWSSPTYLTGYGKLFAGSDATNAAGNNGTHVIGDYAWTTENSSVYEKSRPVGTTGTIGGVPGTGNANELGLYDLSGNVEEWVWDWDAAYPDGSLASNEDAGRGAASGTSRVVRGGSWFHPESRAAVAWRSSTYPHTRFNSVGLRVVRP